MSADTPGNPLLAQTGQQASCHVEQATHSGRADEAFVPGRLSSLTLTRCACRACGCWWFEFVVTPEIRACPAGCGGRTGEPKGTYAAVLSRTPGQTANTTQQMGYSVGGELAYAMLTTIRPLECVIEIARRSSDESEEQLQERIDQAIKDLHFVDLAGYPVIAAQVACDSVVTIEPHFGHILCDQVDCVADRPTAS